jgi:hypothetical protein
VPGMALTAPPGMPLPGGKSVPTIAETVKNNTGFPFSNPGLPNPFAAGAPTGQGAGGRVEG